MDSFSEFSLAGSVSRSTHVLPGKAPVAIARKLLRPEGTPIWHILTKEEADGHASAHQVAASLFAHAYKVGVHNLPDHHSAKSFTRMWLDRLGLGQDVERIKWGSKWVTLPPTSLPATTASVLQEICVTGPSG